MQIWRAQNTFDLATRMLVPVDDSQGGIVWSETMGDVDVRLNRESLRLWLAWRDDAVRSGIQRHPRCSRWCCRGSGHGQPHQMRIAEGSRPRKRLHENVGSWPDDERAAFTTGSSEASRLVRMMISQPT